MTAPTPAILGGPAAFPDRLHLLRPTLPSYADLEPRLHELYASGMLTKGPVLTDYEGLLAQHLGVRHALGVSSCTAGLMLVFDRFRGRRDRAAELHLHGDRHAAMWAGLKPVFADIDPETWCLSAVAAEAAVTADTALVTPVHIFGNPADTDAFDALARRRDLTIVYDAAHGFGALRDGAARRPRGSGPGVSTSPTKLLITGEGGVVATDDDALAERVVVGREYGNPGTYDPVFVGLNARLPEASALLGLKGLALLDREAEQRNALAVVYRDLLGALPGIGFQRIRPQDRSSFKDFSVRIRAAEFGLSRDQVATALVAEGIDSRAYYVPPVHRTQAFAALGPAFEERLPETAALCDEVLTLPDYGLLAAEDVERVAACMIALHERAPGVRQALGRA